MTLDYVPCTMPLNMTIQLDDRPELPLHPLDMTYPPANDASASTCTGIIQTFASIGQSDSNIDADMVLGVPFLRNTYTVLAFEAPDIDGSFAPPSTSGGPTGALATPDIDPRLGLMNLTDPAVAMQEFIQVRVDNQPLDSGSQGAQTSVNSSGSSGSGHHLPIGVDVLLGLMGFLAFCFTLFGARWFYMRNKLRRMPSGGLAMAGEKHQDAYTLEALAHHLSTRTDIATAYSLASQEDSTLRTVRYGDTKSREESSFAANATADDNSSDRELGFCDRMHSSGSPLMSTRRTEFGEDTLITLRAPSPTLARTPSATSHHRVYSGEAGVTAPLLSNVQTNSSVGHSEDVSDTDLVPHGNVERDSAGCADEVSMTGVGTARRSSHRFNLSDSLNAPMQTTQSLSRTRRQWDSSGST